jgi:hypothetical protein
MHDSSRIRTHNPSVRAGEGIHDLNSATNTAHNVQTVKHKGHLRKVLAHKRQDVKGGLRKMHISS